MANERLQFAIRGRAGGKVGAVFLSLFLLVFLAMGLLFLKLIVRDYVQTVRTYAWTPTDCQVFYSQMRNTGERGEHASDRRFDVEYRYQFGGQTYTSSRFALKPKTSSDYGAIERLAMRYAAGTNARCFVNASAPGEAVLQRDSLWSGLLVFFPLIFVAIGGGGAFFTLRNAFRHRSQATADPTEPPGPISERAKGVAGRWLLRLFFGVFALMGCLFLYLVTIRPALRILDGRHWQQTPCVVVSSDVQSHSGDKGTTYSVNVVYRYEVGGKTFSANRYDFLGGSSSGYEGKAAIVRQFPPGSARTCWVNPRDPIDAVLNRGFVPTMWLGLLALAFAGIGFGGLAYSFRAPAMTRSETGLAPRIAAGLPRAKQTGAGPPVEGYPDASPRILKPDVSPKAKVLGFLFVALFWNGIVSVFVTQAVAGWARHRPDWFLTLFMIPFVVIGLGLIGGVVYAFLALFNPRPVLTITPGAPALGETLGVQWQFKGRVGTVRRLRLTLEGREEARYRAGKNTATDKSVFAALDVADTTEPNSIAEGQSEVNIPANLMHSFAAENNRVIWELRVEGEVARWPDVKLTFPVTVSPRKPTASP